MAHAAKPPEAILVAHGSPGDPQAQEAVMMALAVRVALFCPGWRIRGTTLAMPGALEAATKAMQAPLIYPFFMAEGWFTRTNLPRRLQACGAQDLRQLAPFGADPALAALMADTARKGAAASGLQAGKTTLLIAAHGSNLSKTSTDTTWAMVEKMRQQAGFAGVSAGFVEEAPFLETAATGLGPALCLPFFALRAGHITDDVPRALSAAGFAGPLLPPIGEAPAAAPLIAAALRRALAG